jgi:hypothetical protein
VKGLWIELKRECLDLRFVKPVRPAGQALSDTKIVKIQLFNRIRGSASLLTSTMVMSTS